MRTRPCSSSSGTLTTSKHPPGRTSPSRRLCNVGLWLSALLCFLGAGGRGGAAFSSPTSTTSASVDSVAQWSRSTQLNADSTDRSSGEESSEGDGQIRDYEASRFGGNSSQRKRTGWFKNLFFGGYTRNTTTSSTGKINDRQQRRQGGSSSVLLSSTVDTTSETSVSGHDSGIQTAEEEDEEGKDSGQPASVHLQLQSISTDSEKVLEGDEQNEGTEASASVEEESTAVDAGNSSRTVRVLSYTDPATNTVYKALNTGKRQFRSFLEYRQVKLPAMGAWDHARNSTTETLQPVFQVDHVVWKSDSQAGDDEIQIKKESEEVPHSTSNHEDTSLSALDEIRKEWRELWKQGRLLTDRTELLAVYPSDSATKGQNRGSTPDKDNEATGRKDAQILTSRRRGGFADLLHIYTERIVAVLQDEEEESGGSGGFLPSFDSPASENLVSWLSEHYGSSETEELLAGNLQSLSEQDQLDKLKHFLEWFRHEFPYYYDRCGVCGASMKDDLAKRAQHQALESVGDEESGQGELDSDWAALEDDDDNTIFSGEHVNSPDAVDHSEDDEDTSEDMVEEAEEDNQDDQTFVGYIYPSDEELSGKASRTELFRCHVCNDFTRFPRYNSAKHVLESRRGRCGEYSMLLYRFLRALNHECRWVVDWADHVWSEILLTTESGVNGGLHRWVHLDPCEAAVDQNLIYEGWGKKQTFILGFHAPLRTNGRLALDNEMDSMDDEFPMIEDVTADYTSDSWDEICQRRDESEQEINDSIEKAIAELREKLAIDKQCK